MMQTAIFKHFEIVSLILILIVDFSIRSNYFYILQHNTFNNNFTEPVKWPHEIKHFLMPISGNYIQEPISIFLYRTIFMHINLNGYVLANIITFTYTFISIPLVWLLSKVERKYLLYRQVGCVIFQLRNVMDYLDGAVIRGGKAKSYNDNRYIVDNGQLVDGVANALSTVFFFFGTFLYIWHRHHKLKNESANSDSNFDDIERKYETSKLIMYIISFLIYFVIASLGWDIVLGVYTKEVIFNQVKIFIFIIIIINSHETAQYA